MAGNKGAFKSSLKTALQAMAMAAPSDLTEPGGSQQSELQASRTPQLIE
jgi:hypothetical protein